MTPVLEALKGRGIVIDGAPRTLEDLVMGIAGGVRREPDGKRIFELFTELQEQLKGLGAKREVACTCGMAMGCLSRVLSFLHKTGAISLNDLSPLHALLIQLADLSQGVVGPILQPRKLGRGRKFTSISQRTEKNGAAALYQVLLDLELSSEDAASAIVGVFQDESSRVQRYKAIDARRIVNWHKVILADKGSVRHRAYCSSVEHFRAQHFRTREHSGKEEALAVTLETFRTFLGMS